MWTQGDAASIGEDEMDRVAKALGPPGSPLPMPIHPGADDKYTKDAFICMCAKDRLRTHGWFEKLRLHLFDSNWLLRLLAC